MSDQAQKAFLRWLAVNFPVVYRGAELLAQKEQGVAGLGQLGWVQIVGAVVNAVASVAPAVINARTQKRAINLQLEQLRAGMAPLPNEAVGLPPEQQMVQMNSQALTQQTQVLPQSAQWQPQPQAQISMQAVEQAAQKAVEAVEQQKAKAGGIDQYAPYIAAAVLLFLMMMMKRG